MTETKRHDSKSPFEQRFGFCRPLCSGDPVCFAGTAPIGPDGKTFAPNDPVAPTRRCFEVVIEVEVEAIVRP